MFHDKFEILQKNTQNFGAVFAIVYSLTRVKRLLKIDLVEVADEVWDELDWDAVPILLRIVKRLKLRLDHVVYGGQQQRIEVVFHNVVVEYDAVKLLFWRWFFDTVILQYQKRILRLFI